MKSSISNIDGVLDKIFENLLQLKVNFTNSKALRNRNIISWIFPEKFSFSESGYRTPKINEAARLIYNLNKELEHKKQEGCC